ncbi:MAG: phosphoenolpyruvate mutase [Jaaginema sp. PMC 1079.18]|nr:phosphoenolpyruvate mutase [Jaaginema sp. PMC 1080.18]MEC4851868.1 phosphoenolpyruvate mutase [Jaaginema sp. PMC 1079.18]MEC4866432.1 phosphoenolpyruvate mutase [Jaaginema sp. PMC 1078.18]
MSKTQQLRQLLYSQNLEFLLEAHNGLSAKIVEEAGFKGIWASGLSISAQWGVRDSNEASWTQILEVLEFMSDVTNIPILLDGDTGYGNFNNMRRLVKKLEQRDIAGVCIEDKQFPKTNSFINGKTQLLAPIDEFCGKIKAAKDAQSNDDFVVIARIEALIAGWGLSEALKRAEAYAEAGADGLLIHSALAIPDEVLAFQKAWQNQLPVAIVPTKYYATPTTIFREFGFAIAIWANHLLRAAVTNMQTVAERIYQDQNLLNIEDKIVPVSEVFRLQNAAELLEAERQYLPSRHTPVRAILLAASRGVEFGELTADKPKCMLTLQGQPLLAQITATYHKVGIKNITVVRGYQKAAINLPQLCYVDNDEYEGTGELVSLLKAVANVASDSQNLIIGYGDVLLKQHILQLLLETSSDFAIVVDAKERDRTPRIRPDYVRCSLPNSTQSFYTPVYLEVMGSTLPESEICGLWTGLLKVSHTVLAPLQTILKTLDDCPEMHAQGRMPHLMNALIAQNYKIEVIYITGHWLDIDEIEDILKMGKFP